MNLGQINRKEDIMQHMLFWESMTSISIVFTVSFIFFSVVLYQIEPEYLPIMQILFAILVVLMFTLFCLTERYRKLYKPYAKFDSINNYLDNHKFFSNSSKPNNMSDSNESV